MPEWHAALARLSYRALARSCPAFRIACPLCSCPPCFAPKPWLPTSAAACARRAPAGHGRAAQFVRVNLAGALSDGLHRASDDESDLGPDFPVEAAVVRLPDGYSMEVRWPLSMPIAPDPAAT